MDNTTPRPIALDLCFSFNEVRQAAAILGMTDLSDENIEKIFFSREKRIAADLSEIDKASNQEMCTCMVGLMIGLHAVETNNEALIDEVSVNSRAFKK